ncbi:hypothetical protein LZ554_009363 [Drepanopeziza brunnea f. sp. 'monogermtubi']|nr:hypothetical protein LZ554_009363 [Drepanopeziza brunnea f. sp. 'monogermtubi']
MVSHESPLPPPSGFPWLIRPQYTCHHTLDLELIYCGRVDGPYAYAHANPVRSNLPAPTSTATSFLPAKDPPLRQIENYDGYFPMERLINHYCPTAVEIITQEAPYKCKPCRNYDRDRWRRQKSPIPLPDLPLSPGSFGSDVSDGDIDSDLEVDEVGAERGRTRDVYQADEHGGGEEHSEGSGGVSVVGLGSGGAQMVELGPNEGWTNSKDINTIMAGLQRDTARYTARRAWDPNRMQEIKERWGGFGGMKMTKQPLWGDMMEREETSSHSGSRGSSYRGADMMMGGGREMDGSTESGPGLGLGFDDQPGSTDEVGESPGLEESSFSETGNVGLGFGFEGSGMDDVGGSTVTEAADAPASYESGRQRSDSASSDGTVIENNEGSTPGDRSGSVTEQFLKVTESSKEGQKTEVTTMHVSVDEDETSDDDLQESVTAEIIMDL